MFRLEPDHYYRVPEWDLFPWLVHGFGTRRSIPPQGPLATLNQIHSAICVTAGGHCGILGEGDALLEDTPGHAVAVKTADCIPILLVDERHRAVAAVHAGWRGAAHHIAVRAAELMQQRFGSQAGHLHAAIGPGIGPCCYEVGPEVAVHFALAGRSRVDLAEVNRKQLEAGGLDSARIHVAALCTQCDPAAFHSFRRDKEAAGRMLSYAGIR